MQLEKVAKNSYEIFTNQACAERLVFRPANNAPLPAEARFMAGLRRSRDWQAALYDAWAIFLAYEEAHHAE